MTSTERVEGYSLLSRYMSKRQNAVFRLFQPLAARDLLYMQAELVHLENQYQKLEKESRGMKDSERQFYDRNWYLLSTASERSLSSSLSVTPVTADFESEDSDLGSPSNRSRSSTFDLEKEFDGVSGPCPRQWDIAIEIRRKLREYYSAFRLYKEAAGTSPTTNNEIRRLREFLTDPGLGGGCCFAGEDLYAGSRSYVYDEENLYDLVTITKTPGENDLFTRFFAGPLTNLFFRIFHRFKKPISYGDDEMPIDILQESKSSRMYEIRQGRLYTMIDIIGTISSSLAPLTSIIVLYFVHDESLRLGIACAFTIVFTLILALATKARRIEIFAATAAFAGVQVVFIGSTNGGNYN